MFCHNCGQKINDGEKFCTRCGVMAVYKDRTAKKVTPMEDIPEKTASEDEERVSVYKEAIILEDDIEQSIEPNDNEEVVEKAVNFDSVRDEAPGQDSLEEDVRAEIEAEFSQDPKILNERSYQKDAITAYSPEKKEPVVEKKSASGASRIDKPLTTWGFMWRILVCSIPIVGIVFLFVFAFASGINKNSKHFASAMIILNLIVISIFIAGMILIFAFGYNKLIVEWLNAASMLSVS